MNQDCLRACAVMFDATTPVVPAEVRAHLESCPECRRLHDAWLAFRAAELPPVPPPPAAADFMVRREAAACAEVRSLHRHRLAQWATWGAVAACAMLAAGVLYALVHGDPDTSPGGNGPTVSPVTTALPAFQEQLELDAEFLELDTELEYALAMVESSSTTDSATTNSTNH